MNRTTRFVQSEINQRLKAEGLPSLTWYDVLWSIERRGGQLRPYEVEDDVIFEQSNVSYLTKRLAEEGLIEVVDCPEDRRGKLLAITQKGRDLRARMWKIYGPMLHELLERLGAAGPREAFIAAAFDIGRRAPGQPETTAQKGKTPASRKARVPRPT